MSVSVERSQAGLSSLSRVRKPADGYFDGWGRLAEQLLLRDGEYLAEGLCLVLAGGGEGLYKPRLDYAGHFLLSARGRTFCASLYFSLVMRVKWDA